MGAVIVAADDSVDAAAPKLVVRVLRNKAALAGFAARDLVETIRMGLEGENVTPIHSGLARHELPVRVSVSPEHQDSLDKLAQAVGAQRRGRAGAAVGPGTGGSHRAQPSDPSQGPAAGGLRGGRHDGRPGQPAACGVPNPFRPRRDRGAGRAGQAPGSWRPAWPSTAARAHCRRPLRAVVTCPGAGGQPPLREQLLTVIHRLRLGEPPADRIHALLYSGIDPRAHRGAARESPR